ncbi:peroxiredoxin-like family protein [Arthrobacter sp. SX1312]|uniref:peroxiredoxin-like family protein n=1 Tax=Arthrobacter sp. SX1312 TaxID=2058896 RepID=UPI000CE49505|nr:peroxiredoxin-like family protein [Arthrobacter sp. SX1312]
MKQRQKFTDTIAAQVDGFRPTFEAQVGPALAEVFMMEQEELRRAGLPQGIARVGDKLPEAILYDDGGHPVPLREVLGAAAAIIVFYRGEWCPYCSITLQTYQRELSPLAETFGTRLIAVSPQHPEITRKMAHERGLYVSLYSDAGNTLASQLGIVTSPSPESTLARIALGIDVAGSNLDRSLTIPFPTVIVADATGTIRFIDVHVDYTNRTETSDIIDALVAL